MWADQPEFIATVEEGWSLNVEGTTQFKLCKKLKALKNSLKAFNGLHYSHISVRAKEANLALQNAQLRLEFNPRDAAVWDSLGALRKKAVFLAEAERHFYYQKAKIHFLKMGDMNTKFFHDMVKKNAAKRSILAITKSDGSTITSEADIGQEFVAYFTSLLGTEAQTAPAPGPDGFSACFFKRAWNVVGNQVCTAVTNFFRSGRLLRQLNHCIIALVPKSDHSPTVADYRRISCCNVIYKAITKIISDRLAPILEHLIDRSQAAFVGGWSITDNIFLAQEMVRQYTRKRISPRCTINVDLCKAFDSVSWTFLSRVLHSLRQGDPMSPALFLLSIKNFSHLVKRRTSDSKFNFHPKCEKLKITHLLFADDLMLFSRGDLPSIHILMECLQEFRDVSGLAVNTSKSSIFTAGIQNDELHGILARTDFDRGEMPVRYLGIPLAAQRLSVTDYSPLVDQIAKSISKWAAKSLSYAGRLELIRSVIQGGHQSHGRKSAIPRRKADTLWVQWVNGVYLRCGSVWDWQPKKGDSPLLQRLAEIRNRLVTEFGSSDAAIQHMEAWTNSKGLETSKAYEYFRPEHTRRPWQTTIWTSKAYEYLGKGSQHVTDCRSYKRKNHARYASTNRNQPGTFSLSAPSATLCGPRSDTGWVSADVCQPFSAQ
ncbi:UNVERIFIED_CONTAM: hypothetical protein Slati_2350800 [Sesamum latifolium]|uniref:Reverse transcriptase domain-containing protein n=1 Tax=Sesamum latifolium TaxID=2727402 RepID=A0AAW2WB48_9LAMI